VRLRITDAAQVVVIDVAAPGAILEGGNHQVHP
jgi:hypothetical protein